MRTWLYVSRDISFVPCFFFTYIRHEKKTKHVFKLTFPWFRIIRGKSHLRKCQWLVFDFWIMVLVGMVVYWYWWDMVVYWWIYRYIHILPNGHPKWMSTLVGCLIVDPTVANPPPIPRLARKFINLRLNVWHVMMSNVAAPITLPCNPPPRKSKLTKLCPLVVGNRLHGSS